MWKHQQVLQMAKRVGHLTSHLLNLTKRVLWQILTNLTKTMHFRTLVFAYQLHMSKGRLSTLAMGAKGPIVFQRRLSESSGNANGYLVHLSKTLKHMAKLIYESEKFFLEACGDWFDFYRVINSFNKEDESCKINFAHCCLFKWLSLLWSGTHASLYTQRKLKFSREYLHQ